MRHSNLNRVPLEIHAYIMSTPPPKLPTPAELEALLDSPKVLELRFNYRRPAAERDATLAEVPADVQAAAKLALLTRAIDEDLRIGGLSAPEIDARCPRPLAHYMATEDEKVPAAEDELRGGSAEWDLDYYEKDGLCLCDFCGWPGDNASGAAIFWHRDRPDEMTIISVNNDSRHETDFEGYGEVVAKFNAWRRGEEYNPDDE
jgi:hypothetical protein